MSIISKFTGFIGKNAGKIGLTLKAKSPEILIGAGIVLIAGGTVMACRATSKAKKVLQDRKDEIDEIECTIEDPKEAKQDKIVANVRCAWGLTKLYTPAVLMELSGIACFCGSHHIMKQRNAALLAAYNATDSAYRKLRDKVYGKLEEKNATNDIETKNEENRDELEQKIDDAPFNYFAFCFDETCFAWKKDEAYNEFYGKAAENSFTRRLQAGYPVFLNDIRTHFGKEPTADGQKFGWMKELGDEFIDLGITESKIPGERSYWVRPNCHHYLLDSLAKA